MADPFSLGLRAVALQSAYAFPLAFACGVLGSVGPCAAPRVVAAAGLSAGVEVRKRAILLISMVSGLVATYAAFGAAASLLAALTRFSAVVYVLLALALAICGIAALWTEGGACSATVKRPGPAFLLGASFALLISPCCTPLLLGVVSTLRPPETRFMEAECSPRSRLGMPRPS